MISDEENSEAGNKPTSKTFPGERRQHVWHVGPLIYTTGGLAALFLWLLGGDFAWAMKERTATPIVQVLLRKSNASDFLSGILIGSLPALMTLLIGPIISYKSDRHRGKWGRRIPYLAATVPFAVVSLVGLAFSPVCGMRLHEALGRHSPGQDALVLALIGTFWGLFEFASVTTNSLFGGLVNDVVPQGVLGRFYGFFRAASLLAGVLIGFWILGKAAGYTVQIFLGLALLYGTGFVVMCLKVKEGAYPPLMVGPAGGLSAAKDYLKDCFGNSYYWWFYFAFASALLVGLPINLFSVYFAQSVGMNMDDYGWCLAVTYLISLGFAYPLGAIADRVHPLRSSIAVIMIELIVLLCGWFFVNDATTFRAFFIAQGAIGGSWLTVSASLPQRLLPRAKFAQFSSAAGAVVSILTILIGPIMGWMLDHLHHFYRATFLVSFAIAAISLAANLILHARFMALGGPRMYRAPGDILSTEPIVAVA